MAETTASIPNARLLRLTGLASVATAMLLILAKTAAWMLTDSIALLASLVDSMMDSAASLINLLAIRYALIPPDEDQAATLYETTQAVLEAAGFEAYEVSNHARGPAARSVHNLHVWRGGEYLGIGPGAHGRLDLGGARTATVAWRAVADYTAGVAAGAPWSEAEALDPRAEDEERVLLGLRTIEGVETSVLARLDRTVDEPRVRDLVDGGFLALSAGRLAATARGRPVLDALLRALLV